MRLVMIGTGYVGLVSGTCFAEMGNRVTSIDIDAAKIDAWPAGRIPIHEPGQDKLMIRNVLRGHLAFTTALGSALQDAEIALIAVGTPMNEDGRNQYSRFNLAQRGFEHWQIGVAPLKPL